jgi:hypothetical protein
MSVSRPRRPDYLTAFFACSVCSVMFLRPRQFTERKLFNNEYSPGKLPDLGSSLRAPKKRSGLSRCAFLAA